MVNLTKSKPTLRDVPLHPIPTSHLIDKVSFFFFLLCVLSPSRSFVVILVVGRMVKGHHSLLAFSWPFPHTQLVVL